MTMPLLYKQGKESRKLLRHVILFIANGVQSATALSLLPRWVPTRPLPAGYLSAWPVPTSWPISSRSAVLSCPRSTELHQCDRCIPAWGWWWPFLSLIQFPLQIACAATQLLISVFVAGFFTHVSRSERRSSESPSPLSNHPVLPVVDLRLDSPVFDIRLLVMHRAGFLSFEQ